jgi:hypothetical protein
MRFNPPPGWPVALGFEPTHGWSPDPRWPPAPPHWRFWLPDATSVGPEAQTSGQAPGTIHPRYLMGPSAQHSDSNPWAAPTTTSRTPGASDSPVAQRLSKPLDPKTLAGGIGIALGVLLVLTGDTSLRILGLLVAAGAGLVFLRHGYHVKAGIRAQTSLDVSEIKKIITDVASRMRTPSTSIQVLEDGDGQLRLEAQGRGWKPLTFRIALQREAGQPTRVTSHLVHWTWRQSRSYMIPVPFTKRIDGFGLYKTFVEHVLDALRQRDPALSGAFEINPAS